MPIQKPKNQSWLSEGTLWPEMGSVVNGRPKTPAAGEFEPVSARNSTPGNVSLGPGAGLVRQRWPKSRSRKAALVSVACRLRMPFGDGVALTRSNTKLAPLAWRSSADASDIGVVTQYTGDELEHLGLLKIDYLGLSDFDVEAKR